MTKRKLKLILPLTVLGVAWILWGVVYLARQRFVRNYVALREGIAETQLVENGTPAFEYERGIYWNVYYSELPLDSEQGGSDEWYEFLFFQEKKGMDAEELKESLSLEYEVKGKWYRTEAPYEFLIEEEEGGGRNQITVIVRQFKRGGGYFWKGNYRLLQKLEEDRYQAAYFKLE